MNDSPKNPRKSHFLYTAEGKEYLHQRFIKDDWSTYQIAEELGEGAYANLVRRALKYHGYEMRSKADAQKNALKLNRTKHPTEGRQRTDEEKNKIGQGVSETWDNLSPEEIEKRKEESLKRWNKIPEEKRKEMSQKGARGVRKAADEGSKFEKILYGALTGAGYRVVFHKEKFIDQNPMHIDLYLPEEGIAIEVDGPSHFYPIYGEEQLAKRIEADNRKNGLLLVDGNIVIRIHDYSKFHSETKVKVFVKELVELITEVKNNPPTELKDRMFELAFGKPRSIDKY